MVSMESGIGSVPARGSLPVWVLASQQRIPLFGAETEVVRTERVDGAEIVYYGPKGFEVSNPLFWWLWDHGPGAILTDHVRRKSFEVIKSTLAPEELADWDDPAKRQKLLDRARLNFGKRRMKQLFELKTRWLNADSKVMQHFCENVQSCHALDDVYNAVGSFGWNGSALMPMTNAPDIFSTFYLSCPNAQGVRNRYRIVARIHERYMKGKIMSIACGSAQPLIHALSKRKEDGTAEDINVLLVDPDPKALALAALRAKSAGVDRQVFSVPTAFQAIPDVVKREQFHSAEICGLLDYLDEETAVGLIKVVLEHIEPGGTVVVSNMAKTRAERVLSNLYNWWIIYRSPAELARLLKSAGAKTATIYVEPWGIHPVAVITK